jgi:hypothetical protein
MKDKSELTHTINSPDILSPWRPYGNLPSGPTQSGLFDGLVLEFDYTRRRPAAAV